LYCPLKIESYRTNTKALSVPIFKIQYLTKA